MQLQNMFIVAGLFAEEGERTPNEGRRDGKGWQRLLTCDTKRFHNHNPGQVDFSRLASKLRLTTMLGRVNFTWKKTFVCSRLFGKNLSDIFGRRRGRCHPWGWVSRLRATARHDLAIADEIPHHCLPNLKRKHRPFKRSEVMFPVIICIFPDARLIYREV